MRGQGGLRRDLGLAEVRRKTRRLEAVRMRQAGSVAAGGKFGGGVSVDGFGDDPGRDRRILRRD